MSEPIRPLVVFLDVPFEGQVRALMSEAERRADIVSARRVSPEALRAAKAGALACVSGTHPVTAADMAEMPRLRMISAWGVGYDHVDVPAATTRGIPVCINPVIARPMAEAALTLMLALSKNLVRHMRNARSGTRSQDSDRGIEIHDRTVGIVGFGRIGRELGELARRLDMRVVAHDPYLPAAAWPHWCRAMMLPDLLRESDFVVMTALLTPETHHLIGAEQLALMKPSAYLINIARGPLVDERALLDALREGRIAGAGLDVWEEEPPGPDHPLLAMENVIGTPHRLGASVEGLQALCGCLQDNLLRVLNGQHPEHVVNPEVLTRGEG